MKRNKKSLYVSVLKSVLSTSKGNRGAMYVLEVWNPPEARVGAARPKPSVNKEKRHRRVSMALAQTKARRRVGGSPPELSRVGKSPPLRPKPEPASGRSMTFRGR